MAYLSGRRGFHVRCERLGEVLARHANIRGGHKRITREHEATPKIFRTTINQIGCTREKLWLAGDLATHIAECRGVRGSVGVGGAHHNVPHLNILGQAARGPSGYHEFRGKTGHGPTQRVGCGNKADPGSQDKDVAARGGSHPSGGHWAGELSRFGGQRCQLFEDRLDLLVLSGDNDRSNTCHCAITCFHESLWASMARTASCAAARLWWAPQPHWTSFAAGTSVASKMSSKV